MPGRTLVEGRLYFTRLGDQLRASSIGEFAGWDTRPQPTVDASFRALARARLAPSLHTLFDSTPTRY